ncbi:MAG: hypothetical protein JXX29_22205 [Deltaproteobacteria bacterium]|nr:hypothetical protein [Deltaproteobacteria bacterium]MBN2674410.1 hypothetical protein [Deltaproteobacteria bacterium]
MRHYLRNWLTGVSLGTLMFGSLACDTMDEELVQQADLQVRNVVSAPAVGFSDDHDDGSNSGWTNIWSRGWYELNGAMHPFDARQQMGLIINNSETSTNGILEVEMTADRWNGQHGCVAFRYASPDEYYCVAVQPGNEWSNQIIFMKNTTNPYQGTVVGTHNGTSTSFTLKIELQNDTFDIYLNGVHRATVVDADLPAGKVGYGYSDQWNAFTAFDKITWTPVQYSVCGNGVVEEEEVCDDGVNDGSYGGCEPGCGELAAYCGDGTCDAEETEQNCENDCQPDYELALVVQYDLVIDLTDEIIEYMGDMLAEGYKVKVIPWSDSDGGAVELRNQLIAEYNRSNISGAWFIGDLPAAWYEQIGFSDAHEEFPFDFYFMDMDANWTDADSDGIFDGHDGIQTEIFVSRITGSIAEIEAYFDKIAEYRAAGLSVDPSSYLFKDDDWADETSTATHGLEAIYDTVDFCTTTACTTRQNYMDRVTGMGAGFVYQWIHSSPTTLYISGEGSGTVNVSDIRTGGFQGAFYNLFDCSAARFTQENLGMTYVMQSDKGLGILGSTKTGSTYAPEVFHAQLGAADTWGDAFVAWVNDTGVTNELWHMGMVIMGDPMLKLTAPSAPEAAASAATVAAPAAPVELSAKEIKRLERLMAKHAHDKELKNFKEYRNSHRKFFQ